eukprot:jgi/Mesen1/10944/ME000096S10523
MAAMISGHTQLLLKQNLSPDLLVSGRAEQSHAQVASFLTKRRKCKLQSCHSSSYASHKMQEGQTLSTRRGGSTRAAAAPAISASSRSIADTFAELKKKGEVALIPFIVAGDPDLETTKEALLALDSCGADIIELGVPYSDPLADGPVIQAAATRALAKGTDLAAVLRMLSKVSPRLSAPIVLFTYYNPIMKKGAEHFMREAKAAGASGLVIPDIPLEETPPLRQVATAHGLELVLLTTPTTPDNRMAAIAEASQGFVYLVSLTGVTGAREAVQGRVQQLLKAIKDTTDKPVAVGFGISRPEHATQIVEWGADGVIVGSALVRLLGESSSPEEGLEAAKELIKKLKASVSAGLQAV